MGSKQSHYAAGAWPEQVLRESYQKNSKKFTSDIFKSIWQNQTTQGSLNEFKGMDSRINILSEDSLAFKQSANLLKNGSKT